MFFLSKLSIAVGAALIISTQLMNAGDKVRETEITEKQAIELAENFIKVNGYTKFPADTSNVSFEFIYDHGQDIRSVLKKRHNTLHPDAFFITKDGEGWEVGFISTRVNLKKADSLQIQDDPDCRAVTMNLQGTELRMAHKSPRFSKWKRLYKN